MIVSEETGAISMAVDGMLKRHLSAATLDKLLRSELIVEEEKKPTGLAAVWQGLVKRVKGDRHEKAEKTL